METTPRSTLWLRVLDFVTCVVLAGCIAYLPTGEFSLSVILALYLFFGKTKYGPGELLCFDDVKASLVACIAWPYLAWKKLDHDQGRGTPVTYDAYLNDIHVGSLSSTDYSKFQRRVLHDPRLYFAQVVNLGMVLIAAFLIGIPMLAFWGLFALAYFAPDSYESIFSSLSQGPNAIRSLANGSMGILMELWFFSLLFIALIRGHVPGFRNVFAVANNQLLRHHLRVAAEGDITLHLQVVLPTATAQQ